MTISKTTPSLPTGPIPTEHYSFKPRHCFDYDELRNEKPIRGCNIHDRSEWVWYPLTGEAWQKDEVIRNQVREQMKRYRK
jgi:hypothetical protein